MCKHRRPKFAGKFKYISTVKKQRIFYSRNAASPPGNGKCSAIPPIPATPPSLRCCWRREAAAAAAEEGPGGDDEVAGGEEERSEAEAVLDVAVVVGGR